MGIGLLSGLVNFTSWSALWQRTRQASYWTHCLQCEYGAGTLAPEVKGLRHLVSNNVIGGEVQSVVPFLHRKKQDHGAFNPKLCMSSMSFASQVPTVKTVHKDEPVAPKDVTSAEMIIARIPLALSALPPRIRAAFCTSQYACYRKVAEARLSTSNRELCGDDEPLAANSHA
eukprot:362161-Chlamydomonas_euryale.AAC.6